MCIYTQKETHEMIHWMELVCTCTHILCSKTKLWYKSDSKQVKEIMHTTFWALASLLTLNSSIQYPWIAHVATLYLWQLIIHYIPHGSFLRNEAVYIEQWEHIIYLHNSSQYLYTNKIPNMVYIGIVSHTQQHHADCTTCTRYTGL